MRHPIVCILFGCLCLSFEWHQSNRHLAVSRPNWKGIVTDSGLPDINTEQPSALVVQEICDAVEHLRDDLEAARDKLPWVQAEKKEKAAMAGKVRGPCVPPLLP